MELHVFVLIGLADRPVAHKLRISLSSSAELLTSRSLKESRFFSFLRVSLRTLAAGCSSDRKSSHLEESGFTLRLAGCERDVLLPAAT
jgi:hypothetical protein